MMGMTPNEAELVDVENHYPTDRVPMEMKEKSVAENLLDKMSETQWAWTLTLKNMHYTVAIRKSCCKPWQYYCLPTTE